MRVLICGSRTWTDRAAIERVIAALSDGTEIIVGGANGADYIAQSCAAVRGFVTEVYHPDWNTYGKAAGPIRNEQMLREGKPDVVIAFRMPGASRGTDDMCRRARAVGVEVRIVAPPHATPAPGREGEG